MKRIILYSLPVLFVLTGCKKLVDTGAPKTQLTAEKAFADEQSVTAVLSSIYLQFNTQIAGTIIPSMAIYTDELTTGSSSSSVQEFFQANVSVNNSINLNIWKNLYNVIYQCNALLEHIDTDGKISDEKRKQFKGEALFLRGLAYYFLLNMYGEVPMVRTTDVNVTAAMPRTKADELFTQIIADFIAAKDLLPVVYAGGEKVRANKWAAVAMLARMYHYQGKWNLAEGAATDVISSGVYDIHLSPASVFLKNSTDAIFQFWTQNGFAQFATMFIPSGTALPTYPLTTGMLQSFETGDLRKASWVKTVVINGQSYSYPFKYKNRTTVTGANTEYLMLLRLSELYLIRAEARNEQLNTDGAKSDLNEIRNRAGLANTAAQTKSELADAIDHERKVELFAEWGFRFFDLKRKGRAATTLQPIKPNWKSGAVMLPIPYYELLNNPALEQNPGY